MEPRIVTLTEKKLVGYNLRMSLANNKTADLWKSFMPRRKEIMQVTVPDLISMQVYYPPFAIDSFTPQTEFTKWAAVEVSDFNSIPTGMQTYTLTGGLYAVFLYRGDPRAFQSTFQYIFYQWLPASPYVLDDREHFEVLGEKYKNNDPDSEEEIWIPIKKK